MGCILYALDREDAATAVIAVEDAATAVMSA